MKAIPSIHEPDLSTLRDDEIGRRVDENVSDAINQTPRNLSVIRLLGIAARAQIHGQSLDPSLGMAVDGMDCLVEELETSVVDNLNLLLEAIETLANDKREARGENGNRHAYQARTPGKGAEKGFGA